MVRLKVPDHESIQTVKTLLQAEVSLISALDFDHLYLIDLLSGWCATLSTGVEGVERGSSISSHR